jgi:hypothetical protein
LVEAAKGGSFVSPAIVHFNPASDKTPKSIFNEELRQRISQFSFNEILIPKPCSTHINILYLIS